MHSVDYAVARCLFIRSSVRPSVHPSHAGIVSKQLYISSSFFRCRVALTLLVFPYQPGWHCSDGDPPTGHRMQTGYEKTLFSTNISLYLANDAR